MPKKYFNSTQLSMLFRAFDNLDQAVLIANESRKIIHVNQSFTDCFGYKYDEVIGKPTQILYASESDFLRVGQVIANARSDNPNETFYIDCVTKYGDVFKGRLNGGIIQNDDGVNALYVGLITDETVKLKAEYGLNKLHSVTSNRQLSFRERTLEILALGCEMFGLPIGIVSEIIDDDYIVKHAHHPDDAIEEGTVFDLKGTYCSHVYKANDVQGFHHISSSEIAEHPCFKNFGLEAYLGAPIFVDGQRYGTVNFSSGSPCRPFIRQDYEMIKLFADWLGHELARMRDISELKQAKEEITRLANTDSLTGLCSRRYADKALRQIIMQAFADEQPLSIALVDFDNFKNINDTYGHDVGDKALTIFADFVRGECRKSDLVARWGGEEFLLAFPGCNRREAHEVMTRIVDKLRDANIEQSPALSLTVSVGLAQLEKEDSLRTLLVRADKLMYDAKNKGRDTICVG